MSSRMEEAALERARAIVAPPEEEAEETPSSEEVEDAPEATVEVEGEVEEAEEEPDFEFDVVVPEELLAELEVEDDQVYEREPVDEDDDDFEDLEESPAEAQLRKQLAKAEKQAKHFQALHVKNARKNWEAEARQYFPLAADYLSQINADSRRAFLREAKAAHDTLAPVKRAERERYEKVLEKEREKAREEAREEAKKAWGVPAEDADGGAPAEAEYAERMTRARRTGDFVDTVRVMMFPKRGENQ